MPKILVILANSIKHDPSRCVAGRVVLDKGDHYEIGRWIRPLGLQDAEGALYPNEITLNTGRMVEVLDRVEISFAGNPQNPAQPENLTISGTPWRILNHQYGRPPLSLFLETPKSLWIHPDCKNDRVPENAISANPPSQSLYCIRPTAVQLRFFWAWNKANKRIRFSYNGLEYDLGLTDPTTIARYCPILPRAGDDPIEVVLDPRQTALCVSLTGAFHGFHYKLVAAVLT